MIQLDVIKTDSRMNSLLINYGLTCIDTVSKDECDLGTNLFMCAVAWMFLQSFYLNYNKRMFNTYIKITYNLHNNIFLCLRHLWDLMKLTWFIETMSSGPEVALKPYPDFFRAKWSPPVKVMEDHDGWALLWFNLK